jgi:NADH-ubiquinone oxidoreductase chain 5
MAKKDYNYVDITFILVKFFYNLTCLILKILYNLLYGIIYLLYKFLTKLFEDFFFYDYHILFFIIFGFLINFLILICYGSKLTRNQVQLISIFWLVLSFIGSIKVFYSILLNSNLILILDFGNWIEYDTLLIKWEFAFDSMNIFMILTVIIISSLVHIYSFDYMKYDPHFNRFISFLSLFTFFMMILLTANNFIVMFIGWEGVGLSSYLLINFWFTRIQANKAAIKAMIINKIGDFGILIGLILIFNTFQTFNYHVIFSMSLLNLNELTINNIDLICFFLFIGCMGKSAQIGLHMWLPDAMEGPTPVSALIHAATMVTAGVFLVIRCSYLFEFANFTLNFISYIGVLTAIFGASVGFFQYDLKKIIAYSTCSQLGIMFCACGLSAYSLSLFHLINHAFFKALLFLCAGSIIHSLNDEQDIRKMGGLAFKLGNTYYSILIASFSLIGFPYLSGFYSKELILFLTYLNNFHTNKFNFIGICIASIFTVMYSFKILYFVFFYKPNGFKSSYKVKLKSNKSYGIYIKDVSEIVFFVYSVLIFFSIFSGYFLKDILVGSGSYFLNIFYLRDNNNLQFVEFINSEIKLFLVLLPILGWIVYIIFAYIFYNVDFFDLYNYQRYIDIFYFFNKKYFFDRMINFCSLFIIDLSLKYFYIYWDKGVIEKFIFKLIKEIMNIGDTINRYVNFNLFTFLFILYFTFILLIFIFFLSFICSKEILFLNFIILLFCLKNK